MPAPAIVTRHARRQVEGALSVPFTYAGTVRRGLWDEATVFPDDAAGFDQAQHHRSLVVMTEDGPYPDYTTLVCSSVTYEIRRALVLEDGVTSRLILAEVTT